MQGLQQTARVPRRPEQMSGLDQTCKLARRNESDVSGPFAPYDHRFPSIHDLIQNAGQVRTQVCVCGFRRHEPPSTIVQDSCTAQTGGAHSDEAALFAQTKTSERGGAKTTGGREAPTRTTT